MITVLGHDPGTTNAGFAVVSFRQNPANKKSPWQFKIHTVGILQNTLSDLKANQEEQLRKYAEELTSLLVKYKAESVIAERFMIRSFRTATAEYVSFMLGYLICYLKEKTKTKPDLTPIPAVTWKNAVKRIFDLDAFYKDVHAYPHEIDSVLMCFYTTNCLSVLSTAKARKELKCKIESKTTRPPKRVKAAAKPKAQPRKQVKRKAAPKKKQVRKPKSK